MALRINLLPEYVRLRRVFKKILAFCATLFGLIAVVLFLVYYSRQQRLNTLLTDVSNIQPVADQATAAAAEAERIATASQPKRSAVNFIVAASKSGPQRAALLDLISTYIYNGVLVSSLDISDGVNVQMRVALDSPDDYARFLENLRLGSEQKGGTVFTGLPVASGVPGYPPPLGGTGAAAGAAGDGQQPGQPPAQPLPGTPEVINLRIPVDATAVLLHPLPVLPDPTAGAAAGAPGVGGPGGGPPGGPGGGAEAGGTPME